MLEAKNFKDFSRMVRLFRQDISREVFENHRQSIKIKKEKTLAKNLMRIFDATLRISNEKGFQAMSMRNLSEEAGLSMGGLYAYFSSKEELLEMLMNTFNKTTWHILGEFLEGMTDPGSKLRVAIRTHLFLSEAMLPWFYFSYMEARHLGMTQKERAKASELETERLFADIIQAGQDRGIYVARDSQLVASVIKAMLQDWYVLTSLN